MKLVNLTPHDVVIADEGKKLHVFPRTGKVARTTSKEQKLLELLFKDVLVYEPQVPNGAIIECNVEDVDADGIIVSKMVADYLQEQMTTDFSLSTNLDGHNHVRIFIPDTGPESVVRNDSGAIIGVLRLNEYEDPLDRDVILRCQHH